MDSQPTTDALLAAVTDHERDQLFPLLRGSAIVEELTGHRPHRSALHRWARQGVAGVQLRTVTVGRARYSTRRWLLDWFAAVDAARRAADAPPAPPAPTTRPTRAAAAEDDDVLRRHGLASGAEE